MFEIQGQTLRTTEWAKTLLEGFGSGNGYPWQFLNSVSPCFLKLNLTSPSGAALLRKSYVYSYTIFGISMT